MNPAISVHSAPAKEDAGTSNRSPATMNRTRSMPWTGRANCPTTAMDPASTPREVATTAHSIAVAEPSISKGGEKTNMKGTRYEHQPTRVAVQPASLPLQPAILAAAKAAIATGGVTMDIMPKYMTNMCEAIGEM